MTADPTMDLHWWEKMADTLSITRSVSMDRGLRGGVLVEHFSPCCLLRLAACVQLCALLLA